MKMGRDLAVQPTLPSGKVGAHGITEAAPAQLRERPVAMVFELRAESGNPCGSIARAGERLGVNPETL